jgi:hypothetical protein
VQGGDLSCEAETCRARVPLVGYLSEMQPFCQGLDAFPEMQHQVKGGLLLDVVVSKGTAILELLASKQLTSPLGLRFCRC